jgi:putative redox protein
LTPSKNSKTAKVTWEGQGRAFTAVGDSGFALRFKNPASPEGASPMEVVVMAAGACTAMDVIDILRKKRQEVTGFEVNVAGPRASEHPMVFTEINLEYVVRGRNLDPKAVERAIELSLTKYCSVNTMLQNSGAKITSRYRIEEAEEAEAVAA